MRGLAALAFLAAVPAWAQDRPATTPTRDVDVVYRVTAGGHSVEQRTRFGPTQGKVRIDTPSPGLYLVVDHGAHRMDLVSDGDHGVLEMAYDPARAGAGFAPGQNFTRTGADTVAGVPCTEWQTADIAGRTVTSCITADGVFLRARMGATVLVEAIRVAYGPIDPRVFAIPAGYRHTSAREQR
jgi:hypothetical protein